MYDELERLLGYPITPDNFEAAMVEASRPSLVQFHDKHMAAARGRESRVLVRPGIGQVLGVR